MRCASCGQENPHGFRFCGVCGAPLEQDPADEVRKTVTVVFCDLVGSTALGERTDPEVLREVMSGYHAELRAILERHGGTVEKFVGDAAMAVFGLPQVHEDDALRAVRAALEMRAAVAARSLEVRIGVNTGEVVAGAGETLVTGDAVNVAARLEQAAGPGEILIGAATERLVRGGVRAEPLASLTLKGKTEPVPAFRALALIDDVPAFTRPLHTAFVARAEELDALEQRFAAAVETRSPQVATIIGPPGIGKSRLARELLSRTAARVLVGRCLSYGEGITYWPLAEIVAQAGDMSTVLAGSDDAELAALRVGVALGSVDATAAPEEISWGVRKLFEALAQTQPLIVVFDDIHWAEPALLDLIEYVATFAHDAPLFLLCTARSELFEVRPTWAAPKANAALITLEPLSQAETDSLVEHLGHLPDETRARIVAAAEGNPLFVEQLVAMQAEGDIDAADVPPTLQALLAARIDRLDQHERAVVARGSIEGRLFHRGGVAELLPEAERNDVGGRLLTLVRKELIRPDRATVPGDDGFRFGHILIRDAAYESIPKRQRAALHERCANWLVARLGDSVADEVVGYHLEQAYRYGCEVGTVDAEVARSAAERLASAARAARARQDVAATVNMLTRAVGLVPEGALRPRLLRELGEALQQAGELTRARGMLEEAATLARAAGDAHVEWLARVELGSLRIRLEPEGAAEAGFREAEAAIAAGEEAADHEVLARAWNLIGEVHLLRAEAAEQLQAVNTARRHAQEAGDVVLAAQVALSSAPAILFGPIAVGDGLRYVDAVVESLGDLPVVRGFALHVRAHLWVRLGRFDDARAAILEWRREFRELGQDTQYAVTATCAWDVCVWAEDWQAAEDAVREGYEMLEQMGERAFLSTAACFLGESLYRRGRTDEADRYSRVSEELGASDDRLNEASWRSLRAKVAAARGDFVEGEQLAREAVEIARTTDQLELAAVTLLALAEVMRAAGGAGQQAVREAIALYERKGNIVGAQRAQKLLAVAPDAT